MAHTYNHVYGLSVIGLRFFTVYGPWGRPDIVAGCASAVDKIKPSLKGSADCKVYNLGNKDPVTVSYLVDCIEQALGKEAVRTYIPMPPTGDVLRTSADVSLAGAELDYAPTTPLKEGVQRFIDWYKDYYK